MMHSEALHIQDASLPLFEHCAKDVYASALRHRHIIARFGRFPHRNSILGRDSTPEELVFEEAGLVFECKSIESIVFIE